MLSDLPLLSEQYDVHTLAKESAAKPPDTDFKPC